MTTSRAEGKSKSKRPELVVLFDRGDEWREERVALPEGLVSGELEFRSPGLAARGWILALLGTKGVLLRVGTLGAVWATFEPEDRAQLWIPGELAIPEGVIVQLRLGEPA